MTAYQICKRCIMDTTDPQITFDSEGFCNHCRTFDERARREIRTGEEGKRQLDALLAQIKAEGKGKDYDCVIGVSGGVDSTYVAYLVKKFGLRPLAIHFDNGWNSELAVRNVERALKKLDIDLHTYVIDWEVFRNLQLSFLKASVANSGIPTDHAITALLFKIASEKGVRFIIGGSNVATEGILPAAWGYDHRDWKHIKAIHKRFGKTSLKGYPHYTLIQMAYYIFVKKVRFIPILNYIDYQKAEAMDVLQNQLGWQYYGGKHYESIYTRFFQGYILPKKFGFDKRRAHLSTLVASGQMTRDAALEEMKKDPYPEPMLSDDKEYVIKKFDLTPEQFEEIMNKPVKQFYEYPSNHQLFNKARWLFQLAKKVGTNN